VKLRIRIPGIDAAALHAIDRTARLFLGRHTAAIASAEISRSERADGATQHAECEVVVSLRDGGSIRVHDDGSHVQRALRRAAWRLDQRRELRRLRDGAASDPAREPF
jgi:hypothetical protein